MLYKTVFKTNAISDFEELLTVVIRQTNKMYRKLFILVLIFGLNENQASAQSGIDNFEFVENKGQWDSKVKFCGQSAGIAKSHARASWRTNGCC